LHEKWAAKLDGKAIIKITGNRKVIIVQIPVRANRVAGHLAATGDGIIKDGNLAIF
jgi:hypothetical protein